MLESFFFVGLPYVALFVLVVGTAYRMRSNPFSQSALTSQFLESKKLLWGSWPWHLGILVILAGHLAAFLIPGVWRSLTTFPLFLLTIETIGVAAAVLCIIGLSVLLFRRLTSAKLQSVTTLMDFVILAILLFQVLLGLGVAMAHRWGSVWSTETTTPYLWSLLRFHPDLSYVTGMPPMVKMHLACAWFIFLLLPFSRLIHLLSVPVHYLFRPPQKVVWTNARRFAVGHTAQRVMESRRYFLRAATGIAGAGVLLSMGVMDKLFGFFKGPDMTIAEESELLNKKLQRLQQAAHERELELERLRNDYIFVAHMGELSQTNGKYFIDYQMRPALAFLNPDNTPQLISAKCTHLGCTVGSTVDASGHLLCPCHMSYFDIHTGIPVPGSPAKDPLPLLGWVVMDPKGKIVASHGPDGKVQGGLDPKQLKTYSVYIARKYEETA